jgi:hypothetical protein
MRESFFKPLRDLPGASSLAGTIVIRTDRISIRIFTHTYGQENE